MKQNWGTPAAIAFASLVAAVVFLVVHFDNRSRPDEELGTVVTVDKTAQNLGAAYAKAIVAAPLAGLDAASNAATATTYTAIIEAQINARRAAQIAAYQPIADEAARRFGVVVNVPKLPGSLGATVDPQTLASIRAFLGSVATGYRKGAGIK